MIYFIIGTKAQLIKIAPIMVELSRRGLPYKYYSTGQHKETMEQIHDEFGIRGPDDYLAKSEDVVTVKGIIIWFLRLIVKAAFKNRRLFPDDNDDKKDVVMVHGDTLSTLVGALVGRRNHCRVAHVESGLRSGNVFDPFPEEITRRLVFRIADIFFCPGEWAVANLPSKNKIIVNTYENTLRDALRLAVEGRGRGLFSDVFEGQAFGVVSIHRTENIISRYRVERFVIIIENVAKRYPLLVVMHEATREALRKTGYLDRIERNRGIKTTPRVGYFDFIELLNRSAFVISDGGSNQEECFYLGKPVALLRDRTERREGVGQNCIVTGYSNDKIQDFVGDLEQYRGTWEPWSYSPASLLVDELERILSRL